MNNREILLNLIKETEVTKELTDSIVKYFKEKNYDMSIIMRKYKPLLEGNLETIKDEEIQDLIEIFGGKPQVEEDDNTTLDNQTVVQEDDKTDDKPTKKPSPMELHNDLILKNQTLEKELETKVETIEGLKLEKEQLQKELEKLDALRDILEKFSITELGEHIQVDKEAVNGAFRAYKFGNKTEYENTFVIVTDDNINVVSSYYTMKK